MADAKGGKGVGMIPVLAENSRLQEPSYPIGPMLRGSGRHAALDRQPSPARIAAVVTYVRCHFGNHNRGAVSEADIKAMMGQ